MNLPNKLTIGRIIAVPFFVVLYMLGFYIAALVIFILASLTDMLDGKIARKRNLVTNFGKIMDPLADKILVYSALALMTRIDSLGNCLCPFLNRPDQQLWLSFTVVHGCQTLTFCKTPDCSVNSSVGKKIK